MLCQLYLSKVLNSNHEIKQTLTVDGLKTFIVFLEIGITAEVISTKAVHQGNIIELKLKDDSQWDELNSHIYGFNFYARGSETYTVCINVDGNLYQTTQTFPSLQKMREYLNFYHGDIETPQQFYYVCTEYNEVEPSSGGLYTPVRYIPQPLDYIVKGNNYYNFQEWDSLDDKDYDDIGCYTIDTTHPRLTHVENPGEVIVKWHNDQSEPKPVWIM